MRTRPDYYYTQSAVVPYRMHDGALEVLTITSRKRRRWVIPKGITEPGLSPPASAAKEALEEAGVHGEVAELPLGRYFYQKWGDTCTVDVFAMRVTRIHECWEEDFRDREWVPLQEAIERMQEEELQRILGTLPGHVPPTGEAG